MVRLFGHRVEDVALLVNQKEVVITIFFREVVVVVTRLSGHLGNDRLS